MIPGSPREEMIDRFVSELEKLADPKREDRASLARLKRCAGRPLMECRSVMPLFYRLLPYGVREWEEESFFIAATLFPLARRRWTGDLGAALRLLKSQPKVNEDGIDRRVAILLDADRSEMTFRLRQVVCLLAQHELPLDWRTLLAHLLDWDRPSRTVQKQWARSYFGWRSDESRNEDDPSVSTVSSQPVKGE
jgi:CRISPR system Cascade subunit CasB